MERLNTIFSDVLQTVQNIFYIFIGNHFSIMKRILCLGLILASIACSSDQKPTEKKPVKEKTEQKIETININKEKIKANWTAYKFTERAGVSGVFNTINISDKMYGKNIQDVLNNLKFEIPVDGINSNNPERDKKLVKDFFGKMNNTSSLKGTINNINGNNKQGTCKVSFQMNDMTKPLTMEYHLVDDSYYVLKGILDLTAWNAQDAVKSLNEVCKDLHIGKDGVSKLWPDVKVVIQLPLQK